MNSSFELLKLEYEALRKEICQSIDKQHQILLAGYGAIAAIFGYAFARTQSTPLIALSIPCVCLAMSCLWTVECNRMVRGSYHIGYVLWGDMRLATGYRGQAGWEAWIRAIRPDSHAAIFGQIQDKTQQMVVLWIPIAISALSIVLAIMDSRSELLLRPYSLPFALSILVLLASWIGTWGIIKKVSNLAALRPMTDEHLNFELNGEDFLGHDQLP